MNEKKTCKKCSCTKPLTDFYKCKTYKDGRQYYCKICQRQYFETHYEVKKETIPEKNIKREKKNRSFEKFLDKLAGIAC